MNVDFIPADRVLNVEFRIYQNPTANEYTLRKLDMKRVVHLRQKSDQALLQ